ncbi:MAG: amidase family protein [Synechococcales bacterium]|nr:amidase family protein [Synechococcales bacterium]
MTSLDKNLLWVFGIPHDKLGLTKIETMTVKDVFETAGLRTTSGYKPLENYIPEQDAAVIARLKAAGAIILGKSNLAELVGDFQSINSLFPHK